jgi:predicted nucleotidyltransferase
VADISSFLADIQAERDALLLRLEHLLRADPRIDATWLTGSLGRGEGDSLSDIDIGLAVADADCADLVAQRRAFVAHFGEPILIQEAPQNAPPGGAFLLVLYRGVVAPLEVDWFWQPTSSTRIPTSARIVFDRAQLPRSPAWLSLTDDEAAARTSLHTTFFWAMAFIAAKKLARRHPAGAFDLLRMMNQAQQDIHRLVEGLPQPAWGAITNPAEVEVLPPTELRAQLAYLRSLVAKQATLQPTTNGAGGLVSDAGVVAVTRYIEELSTLLIPSR